MQERRKHGTAGFQLHGAVELRAYDLPQTSNLRWAREKRQLGDVSAQSKCTITSCIATDISSDNQKADISMTPCSLRETPLLLLTILVNAARSLT